MALSTGNDDLFLDPKPVSVSSTSSMETTVSLQNESTTLQSSGPKISSDRSIVRSITNVAPSGGVNMPTSIGFVRSQLRSPSTGVVIPAVSSPNTVPEFLYQLTKMLTDNNRDIIEWSNGKIEVHNPHKLQTHVLNRYFRHSKFASFQRQLNYFGFRKLAGKGKMAPCSYVNDATTSELRSLLLIKRKTGNEPKSKPAEKKQKIGEAASIDPVLAGIFNRSSGDSTTTSVNQPNRVNQPQHSQQAIARVAVGRGIRHSFTLPQNDSATMPSKVVSETNLNRASSQSPVQAGLSALTNNFKSSLQDYSGPSEDSKGRTGAAPSLTYVPGSLRRDDSLVDLAMIPMADAGDTENKQSNASGLAFIDFPWDDPNFEEAYPTLLSDDNPGLP